MFCNYVVYFWPRVLDTEVGINNKHIEGAIYVWEITK